MYNRNYNEYFGNYRQDMYNNYGVDNYPEYFTGRMDNMINGYENYNYPINNQQIINQNTEKLYPDIYKIVYPMVVKICSTNTRAITEDLISEMTETIYSNIESEDFVENDVRKEPELKKGDVRNPNAKPIVTEENRQRRPNNTLKSLIRILILRELIGNPQCCSPRPPYPPRPPRPPFAPGMPPFIPRDGIQDMYY